MNWSGTEEWQVYQSDYGFKIKYPSGLHPFEYDGKRTIGFEGQGWKSGNVIIFVNHSRMI